jgi:hypothetical protein
MAGVGIEAWEGNAWTQAPSWRGLEKAFAVSVRYCFSKTKPNNLNQVWQDGGNWPRVGDRVPICSVICYSLSLLGGFHGEQTKKIPK